MSADIKPFRDMNGPALDVCFSLSATENMVQRILDKVRSSSNLYDPQTIENLKQVVKCLLQTRGCINDKFRNTKPWLDTKISANFESKVMVHHGGMLEEGENLDFFVTFDISNALSHFMNGSVIMFIGMESDMDELLENEEDEDYYYYQQRHSHRNREGDKGKERLKTTKRELKPGAFKCEKCGVSFDMEEYLRQHETQFVHDKYRCEECGKSFSWKNVYERHVELRCDVDDDVALKEEEAVAVGIGGGLDDVKESKMFDDDDQKQQQRQHEQQQEQGQDPELSDYFSDPAAVKQEVQLDNDFAADDDEDMFTDVAANDSTTQLLGSQGGDKPSSNNNPMVQCNLCGKTMLKANKSHHKKIHSGVKPHPCDVCGKSFLRHDNMIKHRKIHEHREKIYCDSCGKGFYNQTSLNKHVMREDSYCDRDQYVEPPKKDPAARKAKGPKMKKDPLVECEVCGKMQRKTNLKKHLRIHTGERPYSCTECGKTFISNYNLKLHISINHSTEKREKMLCQTCGAGFLSQQSLKRHSCDKYKTMKMHSDEISYVPSADDSKQVKLSCNICGKVVKSESHMRSHMEIHSDERPYTCEVCGESFRRPYEVNIHKQRYHDKPTCDICATSFTSISGLNRHVQSVHSDRRPFSCEICGKDYKDKRSLLKHKVVHNRDEHVKCKCEVCHKCFFFLGDLKKHYLKVHKLDLKVD